MIWKPHATVAAIVEQNNRFLLVEELIHGDIVYNQPAGHLEDNESFIDAVIRETREESAWTFTPEGVVGVYLWKHPDKGQTFLRVAIHGRCSDHDPDQPLDEGIQRAVWKSRDEIASMHNQLRSPMVLDCIDDYLSNQSYPLDILKHIKP